VDGKDWRQVKDLVTVLSASSKQITYRHKSFSVISFTGWLKEVTHPVKIFIVKGRFRTKVETRLFITNDLTVSDDQVFEFLAKRAEIEYFFRESKTYLGLDQGKYQKLICYRRHFYICMLVWSISRRYIKQKVGDIKTMHGYIMLKNSSAA